MIGKVKMFRSGGYDPALGKAVKDPTLHLPACRYRKAVRGKVGVECEHGYDVCPTCDPCTCERLRERARGGKK